MRSLGSTDAYVQSPHFLCRRLWGVHSALNFLKKGAILFFCHCALFINKRIALNKMFQQNASKFAIFYV